MPGLFNTLKSAVKRYRDDYLSAFTGLYPPEEDPAYRTDYSPNEPINEDNYITNNPINKNDNYGFSLMNYEKSRRQRTFSDKSDSTVTTKQSNKYSPNKTFIQPNVPNEINRIENMSPPHVPILSIQPNLPIQTQNVEPNSIPLESTLVQPPVIDNLNVGINPKPKSLPSINENSQQPPQDDIYIGTLKDSPSFPISSHTKLVGFPIKRPFQSKFQSVLSQRPNRQSFPSRLLPFYPVDRKSNIELDYPTENVLIDGNIPPSMAVKINEAIEYDRFGNAYYKHHYAYTPRSQQLFVGNNQMIERQTMTNSGPHGFRYIREVTPNNVYPYREKSKSIQLIIEEEPQMMSTSYCVSELPASINHLTACALPNDPMRIF